MSRRRYTNNEKYSEIEIFAIICGILEDLSILHKNNIIHCDVKSPNAIFSIEKDKFALCDFGVAKEMDPEKKVIHVINSEKYYFYNKFIPLIPIIIYII